MRKCPCISGLSYRSCCQPLHDGEMYANSAEQLMCSRFSAFCVGNIEYLIGTLHPAELKQNDIESLKATVEQTDWLGLKIIEHKAVAKTATVEFIAYFQDKSHAGKIGQLHEISRFVKEDEHWFYLDGDLLPPLKLVRNELCFCGSGLKFKKCHL